ncbi:hypothetical protein LUZ62_037412 [Rhynchospora pubera]|uniref:GRAS family transcription factor n=1 Tax=Rhynchospora pubera TaxID=906938 RepID=A0AAV8F4Z2_9POAL|nr:hypothetical protein LUZ62_037412 [Rhynchospora pubera]
MEKSQCLNGDASTTPEAFNVRNLNCSFKLNPPRVDNSKSYQEFPDLTSNAVLNYISQMLLEEALDEKEINYEDEMTLQATEKSFYDILGENCPSSFEGSLLDGTQNRHSYIVRDSGKQCNGFVSRPFHAHDGPSWEHPVSSNLTSTLPIGTPSSVWQFSEGAEESTNFLPNIDRLLVDLELDQYRVIQKTQDVGPSTKKKESSNNPRSKKKSNDSANDLLEGRCQKQIAVYPDAPDENVISDTVLLLFGRKSTEEVRTIRKILQKEIRDEQNEAKASDRSMKQDNNHISKDSVDLSSLLASCSEAVFTNDRPTAIELMKKIRECSSPAGDPFQRLAYYFINGLEARLAGTGSEIYRRLVSKHPTLTDILKAYRVYIASCPYVPSSFYLANQTIYNIAKDATRVHITNYGIFHGFQWPSFFEYFSDLKSTAPKIRITVIEEPEPGFRPNKRVDAVGRRLVFYAKQYNVSFEYQGIASKWENVKSEDLNIGKEEKVLVCCLIKSSMLPDETTDMCSPRDKFLKTIRKIKPHAFIHGISNALYNSPFFLGRFRLALSHYTSWFDMLDSTLPRHNPERVLIEREMFIPDAINTIACEGLDRVDRPETYKQWQARHHRAGLEKIPVDSMIIKNMKNFVRECYHKNFFVDEDDRWVLMGWKGRVLYAMSIWKPNEM